MEKWALTVGCDHRKSDIMERTALNYGVCIHTVEDMAGAVEELERNKDYLVVMLFLDSQDILDYIKVIRILTGIPVLVLRNQNQYDSMEKLAAIHAGADEYIQWTDRFDDGIASALALVRRYIGWNQRGETTSELSYVGLFINPRYRTVMINLKEVHFPRKEFDLLYLLASNPGRVFTGEQLYQNIWGDEYVYYSENSLNSCLRRIRRKLKQLPDASCRIENRWGVGYCFVHKTEKTADGEFGTEYPVPQRA
ncbi:MAG: response regulator transcription factor [Lachnospiraceae bacterium]|nr:response regulator transcription factor [Lachnospiraceae bacterium]MCI8958894.1 response regulator transcription factor [Lachnospiraceae bacterium]